jgi:hypothetical protein
MRSWLPEMLPPPARFKRDGDELCEASTINSLSIGLRELTKLL